MTVPLRSPRSADDRLLVMLEMRRNGVSATDIARTFGMKQQYVSTALNRVADEDVAVEPSAAAAYPWRRSKA